MMADGRLWNQIVNSGLPDSELKRLAVGGWFRPFFNGLAWPDLGTVGPAGKMVDTNDQHIARNAWRMLDRIRRRAPGKAKDIPDNQRPA